MPTYVVTTGRGYLDASQRASIAAIVSTAHHDATGAPRFFVQVVFDEKDPTQRFLGGSACDGHIWIRGDIRSGRTVEQRAALMQALMRGVAVIAGVAEADVWVYLCEMAPTDMIEYGHVLPKPGDEKAWFDALPEALRDRLKRLGTQAETFTL